MRNNTIQRFVHKIVCYFFTFSTPCLLGEKNAKMSICPVVLSSRVLNFQEVTNGKSGSFQKHKEAEKVSICPKCLHIICVTVY